MSWYTGELLTLLTLTMLFRFSITVPYPFHLVGIVILKGLMGDQVNWADEKQCFQTILQELAFFYSPRPFSPNAPPEDETQEEKSHRLWQLEHILFPSFKKKYTNWPREFLGREVRQVANLPDLFRIFERC